MKIKFVLRLFGRRCKPPAQVRSFERDWLGLTVQGLPVEFRPVSKYTWINVTRLSYGVPDEEISKVLSGFGEIRKISSEVYSCIYTGVRHVLMEIKQPIPFRMQIAGHW